MRKESERRLLTLAFKQFRRCEEFEGTFRNNYSDDVKFANGDPDNGWQWPNQLFVGRRASQKPTLTVNQIRYFNNLIINEIKKSPPGIVVRPERGGATVRSAEVYSGIIRGICRKSRSGDIFGRSARFQVDGGVAYWRVLTKYETDQPVPGSFDTQTAYLASLRDMMSAYIDPDAKEPDKSDANFGFIFEDVLKDAIHKKYPQIAKEAGVRSTSYLKEFQGWVAADHYRVAEWYNREEVADELVSMTDEEGVETIEYLSKIPEELREPIFVNPLTRRRKIMRKQMKWYKIVGDRIVDSRDWPGIYVPIVQIVGDELIIEGKLDRKGHTRLLKDAQRIDNYWMSAGVEHVALQGKTPYMVDIRGIEGYETYWASMNVTNPAYIPFKSFDEDGRPINPPTRVQNPEFSNAYLVGMQVAAQKLALVSGQRDPSRLGVEDPGQSDVESGRAILAKKAQGDTSNYNFRDNLAIGVAYTGKILLDLLPRILDTERVVKMVAPDGEEQDVRIDPALRTVIEEKKSEDNKADIVFNPTIGTYEIDAESGPDFATQRQYMVEAMGTIVARNQALWGVIGDLLVQNMDFPGAEEMAERIRRTIPKEVLGEGPTRDMQMLMAQNEQLTALLENFTGLLAEKNLQLKNKDEETTIKAMDAETRRIKELGNAEENFRALGIEDAVKELVMRTIQQAYETQLPQSVRQTDEEEIGQTQQGQQTPALPAPRHPAGRIAPDGQEYVETAPGKFARVEVPEEGAAQ